MTRARHAARWLALGIFVASLWLALRYQPAGAQGPIAVRHGPGVRLDLARVCVGEGGWSTERGDCAAIIFVLVRRAERVGVSLEHMARAYSGRHLGVEASPRPWIAGLRIDGRAPAEWPASAPRWTRYRRAWLELLEHVQDTLDGRVLDPCPGADHWGGAMDFWRVPRAEGSDAS